MCREIKYMGNTASIGVGLINEQDYLQLTFSGYNDSITVSYNLVDFDYL